MKTWFPKTCFHKFNLYRYALGVVRERCGDVGGALMWYRRALLEDSSHVPSLLSLVGSALGTTLFC